MLEKLIENPEKYRTNSNFRGTNRVFAVELDGKKFVVKRANLAASTAYLYYFLLDRLFYVSKRALTSASEGLEREAEKLWHLNGLCAPRLVRHEGRTIVREYINGTDFRTLDPEYREAALISGIWTMEKIHERGVIIGDASVKNIVFAGGRSYWCDFDGDFNFCNSTLGRAVDVLKFVYSTYTVTRDFGLVLFAANIAKNYTDRKTNDTIRELVTPGCSSVRLFLPTRVPVFGRVNEDLKEILRG